MEGRPTVRPARGGVPAALILFIILTVVFGGLTYVLYTAREELNASLAEKSQELERRRRELSEKTEELNHLYTDVLDFASEEVIREVIPEGKSVKEYINSLRGKLTQLESNLESFKSQLDSAIERRDEAIEAQASTDRIRDAQVEELNSKMDDLRDEFDTMQEKYEAQVTEAVEAKEEAEKTLREKLEEWDEAERDLRLKLYVLDERIKGILAEVQVGLDEAIGVVVAEVINVDRAGGFATFGIGKEDGIKRGMTFEVFRKDMDTQKIARLVVRDVSPKTSYAQILDENSTRPVIKGDFVRSFFYGRKDVQQKFVLTGKFPEKLSYTRSELEGIIEKWGGEVSDEVDLGVNYLIVGQITDDLDDPENRAAQVKIVDAKSLGISVMTLDRFIEYIRSD